VFEQVTNEVRALALTLGGADVWIEVGWHDIPAGRQALEGEGVAGEMAGALKLGGVDLAAGTDLVHRSQFAANAGGGRTG
jgi:hypothetical protein